MAESVESAMRKSGFDGSGGVVRCQWCGQVMANCNYDQHLEFECDEHHVWYAQAVADIHEGRWQ